MLDSWLDDPLWGETVTTAVYLHAQSRSYSVGWRTRYQLLHGRPADITHLRRFGSAAHKLIPKELRKGNFAPRSIDCIVVGYVHDTTKVCRLHNRRGYGGKRRIINASNMQFDETQIIGTRDLSTAETDILKSCLQSVEAEPENGVTGSIQPAVSPTAIPDPPIRLLSTEPRRSNLLGGARAAEIRAIPAVADVEQEDPTSYHEALARKHAVKWEEAMVEELTSLEDNNTWDYAQEEEGKAIACKWGYKAKPNHDGTKRFKARLVIKGYKQTEYGETFALVQRP